MAKSNFSKYYSYPTQALMNNVSGTNPMTPEQNYQINKMIGGDTTGINTAGARMDKRNTAFNQYAMNSADARNPVVTQQNNTAFPASSVGQVVGDAPYQMSNLPIGSGVNQDLYGAEFNNANRYAGYGEASTGGDIVPPPVTGNAQDTFWENLNRAGGYSAQDWNAMTPEERIKAGALKSNLGSGMEQFGQLASGASALAGIYGAVQNAKYLKDQTKMQKAMIRADDANKSQFAKAAGGTYTKTGV